MSTTKSTATEKPAGESDGRQVMAELFEEYFPAIRAYFRRQGFDVDQATDLAQDTFFRAWRGIGEFRSDASHATWLFKIARHVLLNAWRDRKAGKRQGRTVPLSEQDDVHPPSSTPPPTGAEEGMMAQEQLDMLRKSMDALPPQMRQCLRLRLRDLKYREIAEILGVSIETVKSHLHQARQRLRTELEDHFVIDLKESP